MPLLSRRTARLERGTENAQPAREAPVSDRVPDAWPGRAAVRRAGIFATCANPHCRSAWLQLWRSPAPVFEGGWCCSEACVLERVEAALGREMDGRGSALEGHRHRIPLGLAMLEQGWITPEDLRTALVAQRTAGAGKLGWWLVRHESASEELVARALGLQWGCPVLGMEFHQPDGLTALVPRLFVDAFGALPLRVAAGKILYLGFADRLDPALALAVERMTGLRVESGLVEESEFRPAHARMLAAEFPPAELMEAATEPALAAALAAALERAGAVEARLARVHDCFWLRMWLRPQTGPLPRPGTVLDLIGSTAAH
jgi:hypothetical protein